MPRALLLLAALVASTAAAQPATPAPPAEPPAAEPPAHEPAATSAEPAKPGDAAGPTAEPVQPPPPPAAEPPKPEAKSAEPSATAIVRAPPKPSADARRKSLAIFEFATNEKATEEKARALAVLVATRVSEKPGSRVVSSDQIKAALGFEKQKQLLGCTDESCMAEISGSLGVRYILQGRLDRFGKKYVVSAVVIDTRTAQAMGRVREDVEQDDDLPAAADRIGDRAATTIGLGAAASAAEPEPLEPTFHLNLKLGNTIPTLKDLEKLALKIDLEGDYYLRPYLASFLEVGLVMGSGEASTGETRTFNLVPVSAGVKYIFRHEHEVRPYVGVGLGLSILTKFIEVSDDNVGIRLNGIVGVAYVPFEHVGFNLEASPDLASLTVSKGKDVFFAFNTNFGVVFLF